MEEVGKAELVARDVLLLGEDSLVALEGFSDVLLQLLDTLLVGPGRLARLTVVWRGHILEAEHLGEDELEGEAGGGGLSSAGNPGAISTLEPTHVEVRLLDGALYC